MIRFSYEQAVTKIKEDSNLSDAAIFARVTAKIQQHSRLINKEGAIQMVANELGIVLIDNSDSFAYSEELHNIPEQRGQDGLNVTERKLFEALKQLGLEPEPQYEVGDCVLDFAFPESYWAFEVHGPYHYTEDGKERDKRRMQFLHHTNPPWKVKSFSAEKVFKNPDGVAKEIRRVLEQNPKGGRNLPFRLW